jgi:hypothetical protein
MTLGMKTNRAAHVAGMLLVVAALGMIMGTTTRAALSDNSSNDANDFVAGSVAIGDNDGGDLMLLLTDAKPGATSSACIKVTYSGTLPSSVRLFGTTAGSGLAPYLTLTVTRGTFTSPEPQFASCTNFSPDGTDYIAQGSGVVYKGTLDGFPDSYGAGLVDPTSALSELWSSNESHVYKLTVTLQDNASAQGKTATQTFTWEARNN